MTVRRKFQKALMAVLTTAMTLSCGGPNYFTPMSVKTSDEAVLEDVLKLLDRQEWDAAITRIADMSASARSAPAAVKAEAGAYAGKCGLNLIEFMEGIGSGTLFASFMAAFTNVDVDIGACQAAQRVIENNMGASASARLSSQTSRVAADVNTFMAILGMVKIGVQLRLKADGDNDGSTDAGFDACTADMSDAEVAQVGSGFGLILDNFTAIAASLGGSASALEDLQDQCDDLTPNPCLVTDPDSAVWLGMGAQLALRGLIQSDSIGINACNEVNPLECCIP